SVTQPEIQGRDVLQGEAILPLDLKVLLSFITRDVGELKEATVAESFSQAHLNVSLHGLEGTNVKKSGLNEAVEGRACLLLHWMVLVKHLPIKYYQIS
ncbi:hypothetical protein EK904_000458, partial [Melospiza melodia maxima]